MDIIMENISVYHLCANIENIGEYKKNRYGEKNITR